MRKYFTILFFLASLWANAAIYIVPGYGFAYHTRGLENLQSTFYSLNQSTFKSSQDQLKFSPYSKGLSFELYFGKYESKSLYGFILWENRNAKFSATDASNTTFKLKHRINNLSLFAFGYRFNKHLGIAISPVDIGNLKILSKTGADSYDDHYNVEKGLLSDYTIYGSSVHIDAYLTENIRLRVSGYACRNYIHLTRKNDPLTSDEYGSNRISVSFAYLIPMKS